MWTTIGESSNDTAKTIRHPGDPYMSMWVHVLAWYFLSGFSFMYIMDVWMYVWSHTKQEYMDQAGKVAKPARGQLNRENEYFSVRVRA